MQQTAGMRPTILATEKSLRPILSYDSNINGGINGESFEIGGLEFEIAPKDQAKSGFVAGLAVGLDARIALAPGNITTLSFNASQAHSFDYAMDKLQASTSICDDQFLGKTSWLSACFGNGFSQSEKGITKSSTHSFGGTRLFASKFGYHEASIALRNSRITQINRDNASTTKFDKKSLYMKLTTAKAGLGALMVDAEFGEYIAGENTSLINIGSSLTRANSWQINNALCQLCHRGRQRIFR